MTEWPADPASLIAFEECQITHLYKTVEPSQSYVRFI